MYWHEIMVHMQYFALKIFFPRRTGEDDELHEDLSNDEFMFNKHGNVTKVKHARWVDKLHSMFYLRTVNGRDVEILQPEFEGLVASDDPHALLTERIPNVDLNNIPLREEPRVPRGHFAAVAMLDESLDR